MFGWFDQREVSRLFEEESLSAKEFPAGRKVADRLKRESGPFATQVSKDSDLVRKCINVLDTKLPAKRLSLFVRILIWAARKLLTAAVRWS